MMLLGFAGLGFAGYRVNGAWIFLRSGAGKFPSWRIGDQP
jgi:hypothetical protein